MIEECSEGIPRISDSRVREAIDKLPFKNQEVIYWRYWDVLTIEEISNKLGLKWKETDRLIGESLRMLKEVFLNDFYGGCDLLKEKSYKQKGLQNEE